MRAVETLIVFLAMIVLIVAAGGWAYQFALVQARAGEVRYAIGVMLQTAEAVDNIVFSRGGSASLQFKFQYGGVVIRDEDKVRCTVTVRVGDQPYTPAPAQSYTYRPMRYYIDQPLFTSNPIYDRGFENRTCYRIDKGEEPSIVYHYTENETSIHPGRTYVIYYLKPFASIATSGGKTTVHITFVDFQSFSTKGQSVVFTLSNQTTSSLYLPISSNSTVKVQFSDVVEPVLEVGVKAGDVLEVYVHQIQIASSLSEG
jgi:hypothetical protein